MKIGAFNRDEHDDRQDQCLVGDRDNECYAQQGNDVDAVVVRYNNILNILRGRRYADKVGRFVRVILVNDRADVVRDLKASSLSPAERTLMITRAQSSSASGW